MAISYNSNYDETVPFSDVCEQIGLTVGVAQSFTVPGPSTTRYSVRFGYNSTSNIFVRLNSAGTVPPGGTTGSQPYNEFRPGCDGSKRYVSGGDVLYFITPDATAYVGISLMQVAG